MLVYLYIRHPNANITLKEKEIFLKRRKTEKES